MNFLHRHQLDAIKTRSNPSWASESERERLIADMIKLIDAHGLSKTFIGTRCLNNPHFHDRLLAGAKVRPETVQRVRDWMASVDLSDHNPRTCEKSIVDRVRLGSKSVPGPLPTPCLEWTGGKTTTGGYARVSVGNKQGKAHRALYIAIHGDPGDHIVIDHICSNRLCVNIDHLQAVTHRTNVQLGFVRRGVGHVASASHCVHGHPQTPENTVTHGRKRVCRICAKRRAANTCARRRAATRERRRG